VLAVCGAASADRLCSVDELARWPRSTVTTDDGSAVRAAG
jgi:dihydroorotate dehydrogenase electron transfer subunit